MPRSSAEIRPELGKIAEAYFYEASRRGFIGLELMPIFSTDLRSSTYPFIPIKGMLGVGDTARAPRTEYNTGEYEFSFKSYTCEDHGWVELLDDVEAKVYKRYVRGEIVATKRGIDRILRSQEKRISSIVMNEDFAIETLPAKHLWTDIQGSDPKADVKIAKQVMRDTSGLTPSGLVISKYLFDQIVDSDSIKDYLKYTNAHLLDGVEAQKATLARYFAVPKIWVADALMDRAKPKKDETDTSLFVDIWGNQYASLVTVSDGGDDLSQPCLGRTFLWTDDSPTNITMEVYRDEAKRSNAYRARQHTGECPMYAGANVLISNVSPP